MGRQWTENQSKAISARNGTILVSAAAGSGKTAVLVERVIQMLTDKQKPTDADRLLVVTYTKAAAAEMRQRISYEIEKRLIKDPLNKALQRQQALLYNAHISTIHSFCSSLVRENFYKLDISKNFRIADESELKVIKDKAMQEILEKFYSKQETSFYDLVDTFSSPKNDLKLQKIIYKMHEFLLSHPFPKKWLNKKLNHYNYNTDTAKTIWGEQIIVYASSASQYCISLSKSALSLLMQEPEPFLKAIDLLESDIQYFKLLNKALEGGNWDEIVKQVNSFVTGTFTVKKGFSEHPLKKRAAANRDLVKSTIKTLKSLFFQGDFECRNDIKILQPIVTQLFNCVYEFSLLYDEYKREKNIADYSDLEHWALSLLVTETEDGYMFTESAKQISQNFDAVMVDEYQDANEVQDLIFKAVSNNDTNLFVVGDVKQSIYSFRQAMPEIFLARKNRYPLYNKENDDYPARIILDKNFRSRSGITDCVNFVFDCLMSKEVGDLEYTDEERLTTGASFDEIKTPQTELHLFELDDNEDMCIAEAHHIAELIIKIKQSETITQDGMKRKPENKDFAILLRNANNYSHIYVEELKKFGINAVCDSTDSFFASKEISIILNFLRVIDNPIQDIPLLSVMMSPIYGFTADDMAKIRIIKKKGNLYSAVKINADNNDKKCIDFLEQIARLRTLSVTMTVDQLINTIYQVTSYPSIVSAVYAHESAANNLYLLQEYARQFENNGYKGLSAFVTYINKLQNQNQDLSSAADNSNIQLDSVRVMSVHRSKGLEFPICILANTTRQFVSDTSEDVLLHSELGFACKRIDNDTLCKYTTMPREAIAIEKKRSEKSEELRVLYVAMTRAKEKLIMLCSKKKMQNYVCGISDILTDDSKISPYIVRNASYLSEWIIMCGLLHPSGKALRDFANRDINRYFNTDTSNWKFEFITLRDRLNDKNEQQENSDLNNKSNETANRVEVTDNYNFLDTINSRINFVYKNEPIKNLPVKISASELAHKDADVQFSKILKKPSFIDNTALTGAEKGTALHLFMQHCDFKNAIINIEKEIKRLSSNGYITQLQADSIDKAKAQVFLNSNIVEQVLQADKVYRELRFTVKIDASQIDQSLKPPFDKEKILLQGAIDLIYLKDKKLTVVDYKTDRVKDTERLKEMYKSQLYIYKDAAEQCLDYKVDKCLIYSIYKGESIEV